MRSTGTHRSRPTRRATVASAFRCGSRRTSTPRIRTARRFTSTSVALLLLAGCGGAARPVAYTDITPKVGALEFTHLTVDVSKSRTELLGVLERNNPGRPIGLPPIDFSRHETFLVAVGPRSSTGYALSVVRVLKKGGLIQVVMHERTPSLGDQVQVRVTYPFRLIVLPRSGAAVKLKWPGRP